MIMSWLVEDHHKGTTVCCGSRQCTQVVAKDVSPFPFNCLYGDGEVWTFNWLPCSSQEDEILKVVCTHYIFLHCSPTPMLLLSLLWGSAERLWRWHALNIHTIGTSCRILHIGYSFRWYSVHQCANVNTYTGILPVCALH